MTQGRVDDNFTLYRFFDASGQLLYVGKTISIPSLRFKNHAHEKAWWRGVAEIKLQPYPTHDALVAAEKDAIRNEHPLHNFAHNGRPAKRRKPVIRFKNGRFIGNQDAAA